MSYTLRAHFRGRSCGRDLAGAPTLRQTEKAVCLLLDGLTRMGSRQDLEMIEVLDPEGMAAAVYSGRPEVPDRISGFEVRGVPRFAGASGFSVKVRSHVLLEKALLDLRSMEQQAEAWMDYASLYVCPSIRSELHIDDFDPADAAAWNCWMRRQLAEPGGPYLLIVRSRRGPGRAPRRFSAFSAAHREYERCYADPASLLNVLPRYVALFDAAEETVCAWFSAAERLEELRGVQAEQEGA